MSPEVANFVGKWLISQYFPLTPAPDVFVPGETTLNIRLGSQGYRIDLTGLNPDLGCQDVSDLPAQVIDNALVSDTFQLPCPAIPLTETNLRMAEPQGSSAGGILNATASTASADAPDGMGAGEEPVASWTAEEEGGMIET